MNELFPQNFASATHQVIEYLSQPGSSFGSDPDDVALLENPEALREHVNLHLDSDTTVHTSTQTLAEISWEEVNWPAVAEELRLRLRQAGRFFDEDLPPSTSSVTA
jgi:hypothetical protein